MEDHQWELLNKIHEIDKRVLMLELSSKPAEVTTSTVRQIQVDSNQDGKVDEVIVEKTVTKEATTKDEDSKKTGFFQNKDIQGFMTKAFMTIGGLLLTAATSYLSNSGGGNEKDNNNTPTVSTPNK